jgi:hypothetical protein
LSEETSEPLPLPFGEYVVSREGLAEPEFARAGFPDALFVLAAVFMLD